MNNEIQEKLEMALNEIMNDPDIPQDLKDKFSKIREESKKEQEKVMNKEQIIDEAYKNYCNNVDEGTFSRKWLKLEVYFDGFLTNENYSLYTKEEFINKCKTDTEFSENWRLKIEERELSLDERIKVGGLKYNHKPSDNGYTENDEHRMLDEINIPTTLTTITYNNKTIESYE
jgi:hypothetical protein